MIQQEIADLAGKLCLMMETAEFQKLLTGITLSATGKKDLSTDGNTIRENRLLGSHRIPGDNGADGHCFFTFESGKLTFYEINAQFDYNETNYGMLSGLFNELCPVLTEKYHQGKTIYPMKRFNELVPAKLPTDGYPCDRYIIGAMHQWEEDRKIVSLSFALVSPGYFFFQLRAIRLA